MLLEQRVLLGIPPPCSYVAARVSMRSESVLKWALAEWQLLSVKPQKADHRSAKRRNREGSRPVVQRSEPDLYRERIHERGANMIACSGSETGTAAFRLVASGLTQANIA